MPKTSRKRDILRTIHAWPLGGLWVFLIKQSWAALFGGLMLCGIIVTSYIDLPWLARYDWLFLWAIASQIFMLLMRLEKPHEVVTIVLFHLVGLGMEVFKTSSSIGSWSYGASDAFFHVAAVPLFSGFMYAAVGSYIARAWRVLELEFAQYPRRILTIILAVLIYVNFFTHHYMWDFRIILFGGLILLYWRTTVSYKLIDKRHKMPLLVGFGLIAIVIWLAENVGTYTRTWLYPDQQAGWHMVSLDKVGSWLLLMVISFIMVECLWYIRSRRRRPRR